MGQLTQMLARPIQTLGVVSLLLTAAAAAAQGQTSAKVVEVVGTTTLIAPFPPGGPVDTLARIIATGLQAKYQQPVIVDNRPGAAGNIGIEAVKRAAPDGRTLLVVPAGNLTINPTLMPNIGYSIDADFVPVTMLAKTPNVVAVYPLLPAKSIQELVALSKAKPDTLAFASPGVGSGLHLAGELFKQQSGANLLHVPYKGSPQALNDVIAGQVGVMFGNLPTVLPQVRAGKVRALAVIDTGRSALLPDVPTLQEAGVPGVVVPSWYGLLAPKGTPDAVTSRIASDVAAILQDPHVVTELRNQGMEVWLLRKEAFADHIHKEASVWAQIIKTRGIKVE